MDINLNLNLTFLLNSLRHYITFDLKLKAKSKDNTSLSIVIKIIINSLYGRIALIFNKTQIH